MRISIALVIYVSLNAGVFAATVPGPDWSAVHAAAVAALERRNYEEAMELFKQSWSLAATEPQRGVSASDMGETCRRFGRLKDATEWLERAHDVWRSLAPQGGRNLAVVTSQLGELYREAGEYAHAETLLREALAARHNDATLRDKIRDCLGDLLREEGQTSEAQGLFSETLRHQDVTWEERVNALCGLADIARLTADWDESERKWGEVIEIARQQKDLRAEAIGSRGLATTWLDVGNVARAEPLFRRALSIMENNPAAPPEEVASALSAMAGLYRAENKLQLAEEAWSKALELERAARGDLHPQVAGLKEPLAEVYAERGERDLALNYATQAVDAMQRLFGESALPSAVALMDRAAVERLGNDLDAAAKDYDRAFAIAREHHGNSPLKRAILAQYADVLKAMHRGREAKELSAMARSFRD